MTATKTFDETAWRDCGLGMSNYDGQVDDGFADALRGGDVFGHHYAYNFCGRVWWDGNEFVERVKRHWVTIGHHRASTLEDLMREVNGKYGSG
jgi:hypothetical protein